MRPPLLAVLSLAVAVAAQEGEPKIRWQRTLEDALHLAKEKKLPLLVVANKDGEPASEVFAGRHYRDADFAKLTNRYVAVIASLDRHNPTDHDAAGRRIACPRFGCVTCGEHIAIEPKLFAKYFKDNPVAPRHIGVAPDGKELFDRFLDRDLDAVVAAVRGGAKGREADLAAKDRSPQGLLRSRAHADRGELEQRFLAADAKVRAELLRAAAGSGNRHPDLVHLALAGDDPAVRAEAVKLLAATITADDLMPVLGYLAAAKSDAEHEALVDALGKPAASDDTCRRAVTIRRALAAQSTRIDPAKWREWTAGAKAAAEIDLAELDVRIEANIKAARAADPGGKLWMQIAQDTLSYALDRIRTGQDPTFLLQDAADAADKALAKGFPKADAAAVRAHVLWLQSKPEPAGQAAEDALGSPRVQDFAPTATGVAVLEAFAGRQVQVLGKPVEKEADYPATAVTDAHRAYEAIGDHPLSTEAHAVSHVKFLLFLGARRECGIVLRRMLPRFPTSTVLHEEFRNQVWLEGGNAALLVAYDGFAIEGAPDEGALRWYAGYAACAAAAGFEQGKQPEPAKQVYAKAAEAMARSGEVAPVYLDSANHWIAVAKNGTARLAMDAGDLRAAVEAILAGAAARPASFAAADGQGSTLARTATRLRRRLKGEDAALLERLDGRLRELGLADQ